MSAALTAIRQAGAVSMISELNVENPDNMYLIARSGMVVVLGNSENLDNKLVLASAAISDLQAQRRDAGTDQCAQRQVCGFSCIAQRTKKVGKLIKNFVIRTLYPLCKRREIVYNIRYYGYVAVLGPRAHDKAGDGGK